MTGTSIEYSGLKWIARRAEKRLDELHLMLEAPGVDMETTSFFRGQIQEVRRCIDDAKRASQEVTKWDEDTDG